MESNGGRRKKPIPKQVHRCRVHRCSIKNMHGSGTIDLLEFKPNLSATLNHHCCSLNGLFPRSLYMVAELLNSPTGVIHFGLVIVSGDCHVTGTSARQIAACGEKCEYTIFVLAVLCTTKPNFSVYS